MIIGLTGKNASGKGEVANYLMKNGFSYFSLSDIIREEAKRKGIEETRTNLIEIGNNLRKKHGCGVLAKLANRQLKDECIIDSIRNPAEIVELRKSSDFVLIGVDAPIDIRFERARRRGRNENALTLEEFKEMEERENLKNSSDKLWNNRLDECVRMADSTIINDGSISELHKKVDEVLKWARERVGKSIS
jgi:dephospho-CoA kinase